MAEPRRVQLTTLSSDLPASSDKQLPPHKPASSAFPVKENCSEPPADTDTVRLVLTLFEPDERRFPEFSYSQHIENKINHTSDKVPLSRFEEEEKRENDEVVAIARKLEEKYGGKPKKKDRIQDLIDIGYGYDDEDSFIDNSEAYDEFVPASITTKFGGFYVNSGVLQFRQASDTETDTEDFTAEDKTVEHSKKRKLNAGQDQLKKKRCRESEEKKNNMDSLLNTLSEIGPNDELKKKKKKKAVGTLSVTSMLKKFQREKEKERKKMEKTNPKAVVIVRAPTMPLCPADAAGGGGSGFTDPLLSLIGSTNDHTLIQAASTVDFDIDLDSLLDVSEETLLPKPLPQPAIERQLVQPTEDQTQLNVYGKAQTQNTKTNLQPKSQPEQMQLLSEATSLHQLVPMPGGLTPALEESIQKLTVATKTSEGESKLKFFTPEINSMLLDIELQCREQGGQVRSKVYTHLSSFLPCSRETLFKRVKKLLVTHMAEPPDVEDPMQKLKEAIGRAMPEQIACYLENCQAYEQVKFSKATEEGKEDSVVTEDNVEEKGGKRAGPKKLFKWNEEIRECLCHVLMPKMVSYTTERKGSQEIEYLKTLLDNEVKPLWPKGWMQSRVLIRESRKLLGLFTSLPVKKARPLKKHPDVLRGTPPLKGELPQETDDVFIEGSDIPLGTGRKEGAALKKGQHKKGGGMAVNPGTMASVESGKPLVTVTSTRTSTAHSLLDLLADQALAQEQPLPVRQELLTAAVAKYQHSVQRWSFGVDTKSPPLPPPPPQSSPVSFPVSGTCHVALPQLLQERDFAKHMDVGHVQIILDDDDDDDDDADITIQ